MRGGPKHRGLTVGLAVVGIMSVNSAAGDPSGNEARWLNAEAPPATAFQAAASETDPLETTTTAAPSTAAPATAAPPTAARPRRSARMAFTGDVLIHARVWQVAAQNAAPGDSVGFDFGPMFEPVRRWIEDADWAICHLEVNLSAENGPLATYPVFTGPGAVAEDLKEVGYDSCSTASNHSLDGTTASTFETLDVLDAAGLGHSGTARSAEESTRGYWIDVDGIQIAHFSYAYGFNGFELPTDQPWAANEIDETRILQDAATARSAGADFVVLSLHWGNEYLSGPSAQQTDLGPRLLASPDVDLIVGHHAHVVQPIEYIDGEWLVYGLGNMISNQTQLPRRDELLVTVTITETDTGSFTASGVDVLPIFVDNRTLTIWPTAPSLRPELVTGSQNATLEASWERVRAVLETGSGWNELELVGS